MEIRHICSKPAVTCSPTTRLLEAAEVMRDHNVGCLVVVRNGVMAGIVTDRDLVVRAVAEGKPLSTHVEEVMSGDTAFVFEGDDVETVATVMATRGLRRLPVLTVHGVVTGMITTDDLTSYFGDQFRHVAYAVRSEIKGHTRAPAMSENP